VTDWAHPVLSDGYSAVLTTYLSGRDIDALTLQAIAASNPPTNAIKLLRTPVKFQNYNGASYDDLLLDITGGGTGAASAAVARTNLGLGSMAVQNSTGVSITGGSISGITLDASVLTTGIVALLRGGTGASLTLGASGTFLQSSGAAVVFGVDGTQLTNLNATNLTSGTVNVARLPTSIQLPAGVILLHGGTTAPTGYLLCDGSAVSRAGQAALFTAIGTTYGAGDGSTTFNIPDLRQRFPLGKAVSGTGATLGGVGGAIDHQHSNNTHTHTYSGTTNPTSGNALQGPGPAGSLVQTHAHSYSGTVDAGGAVNTQSNNPPFLSVNYIIKT